MSLELKMLLSEVAEDDEMRKEIEFEEGLNRFKSLLLKVARTEPYDVIVSFEGTEQLSMKQNIADLNLLEKAHLLKAQFKETGRNLYREYELTPEGAKLAEKLSKEP